MFLTCVLYLSDFQPGGRDPQRGRQHRRPQKFFQGVATSTFCLSFSCCWWCNANSRSHNALPFLHHNENAPCDGNCRKNRAWYYKSFLFHTTVFADDINLHICQTPVLMFFRQLLTLNYVKLTTGWEPTNLLITTVRLILFYYILKNTILLHVKLL